MNEMPLISVIVPVYNIEDYLIKCVDSIISQTYQNIEIILIDDGSTDNSGKICDEFGKKDPRIKVIHKTNGGLSDARNIGLDNMSGEYVAFIDSDDFVSKFYLENMYKALMTCNSKMAASWFVSYYNGDTIHEPSLVKDEEIQLLNKKEYYKRMLYQDGVEVSAWGKLYRRELFHHVRFPKGKVYEDVATIYKLVDQVETIAVISNVDYYYLQRKNSIAKSFFSIQKMDAIEHMKELLQYIDLNFPELNKAAACRYFSALCNIIFLIEDDRFEEQRHFLWNEIKSYRRMVLFNPFARKKARAAAILSYAGYHTLKKIYVKAK